MASAGDVNSDGYADLIVGARYQDNPQTDEGAAYIYYGGANGLNATPDVALDNPFDETYSYFGYAVSSTGDVNGDGFSDFVVGAYAEDNPETGEGVAFVYYGAQTGLSATPDVTLDNPLDFSRGYFGFSVAHAGDINGDGYADLIVGAYNQTIVSTGEGGAYVYLGRAAGLRTTPDVSLSNPLNQVRGYFGISVASADPVDRMRSGWDCDFYHQRNWTSRQGTAHVARMTLLAPAVSQVCCRARDAFRRT